MRTAAIVANPSKIGDRPNIRTKLGIVFHRAGWERPLWLETSQDDPGAGQAREALTAGVDLVCPLGGDGTVRNVADVLIDTDTPMGILPVGTGNLLSRNLGSRMATPERTLRALLNGRTRTIDTMLVELDTNGDGEFDLRTTGTVMAGIGLDADIINSTDESLKAKIGWLAYPLAGTPHIRHSLRQMTITYDDDASVNRDLTSLLIGNCGKLTGGVRLMPDAEIDDGELDAVELRAAGVAGWLPLVAQVLGRSSISSRSVRHRRCRQMTVTCTAPQMVEIDGDVFGRAYAMRVTMRPASLRVRVPD